MTSIFDVWIGILGLVVAVIGAWGNIRALASALGRGISGIIVCPDPLSIQFGAAMDNFGWRLSYPLAKNPRSLDSYRRHLTALRENEAWISSDI